MLIMKFQSNYLVTTCSCHVTYTFQSGTTLYKCLNVKELLSRSRCKIWGLSDCNWTGTQNHLVHKRTLNHLAKLANDWVVFWVRICMVYLTVCSCHVTYAFHSGSTLKCVRSMTRTYSQMHCTNKYSEHSSIIGQFGQMVECSITN